MHVFKIKFCIKLVNAVAITVICPKYLEYIQESLLAARHQHIVLTMQTVLLLA
jgi:hypothetical protein